MKTSTGWRIFGSLVASNIGIALMSYAGYRMGWWENNTMWKALFYDGVWFSLGSVINMLAMVV